MRFPISTAFVLVLPITAALVGCSDQVSFEDEGRLCAFASEPALFGESNPQDFAADAPVELMVVMEDCAPGCATDVVASCEARLEGEAIAVTSSGSYRDGSSPLRGCGDVCITVVATCETPPLAAGNYDVVHGDATLALDIPAATQSAPCIDSP